VERAAEGLHCVYKTDHSNAYKQYDLSFTEKSWIAQSQEQLVLKFTGYFVKNMSAVCSWKKLKQATKS